jgi:hypothetical protein
MTGTCANFEELGDTTRHNPINLKTYRKTVLKGLYMSIDVFVGYGRGNLDSPATGAISISPNDSSDLSYLVRAIYVGGDGNITLVTTDNQTVTFIGLVAGTILPVRAKRVNSTDTTATNLIGLY